MRSRRLLLQCFFFNDTATTEIYTLFPTRRSSDLRSPMLAPTWPSAAGRLEQGTASTTRSTPANSMSAVVQTRTPASSGRRSEEHTSELQSRQYLVCRLLLEKKIKDTIAYDPSADE